MIRVSIELQDNEQLSWHTNKYAPGIRKNLVLLIALSKIETGYGKEKNGPADSQSTGVSNAALS
jgi:hypothetical protein